MKTTRKNIEGAGFGTGKCLRIALFVAVVLLLCGLVPGVMREANADALPKGVLWVAGFDIVDSGSPVPGNRGLAFLYYDSSDNPCLYLKDFEYEGEGYGNAVIYYSGTRDLDIVITGTNSLKQTGTGYSYGIWNENNVALTITSDSNGADGSLTVQCNNSVTHSGSAIYCKAGSITISHCTLNAYGCASGTGSHGIYCYGDLTINSGAVKATSGEVYNQESQAIYAQNISITNGVVTAAGSQYGEFTAGLFAEQSITISGGTVNATGKNVGIGVKDYETAGDPGTITIGADVACVTASGAERAIGGNVKNSSSGVAWKNPEVTGERFPIAANPSGGKIDAEYRKVCFHEHCFTYALSDDQATITATCGKAGCYLTDKRATLTIVAPEHAEYGDGKNAAAGLTDDDSLRGETVVIYYTVVAGELWDGTTVPPINAGDYQAWITPDTPGDMAARVKYTIALKGLTVSTNSAEKVYDGTELTAPGASIEGLAEGETATVKATGTQTEVGSSQNTYYIDWGTASELNYRIAAENLGTLTVKSAAGMEEELTDGEKVPLGQTGWVKNSDGSWSYGDEDGNMTFGPVNLKGYVYCFNEDGKMITGWALVDGSWYYADPEGTVHHNSWMQVKGNWYHFGPLGQMAVGWTYLNGNWYHMNAKGEIQTGWVWIGNDWYYFSENGTMVTGWLKDGEYWYRLRTDGGMATGWFDDGGTWYYFKPSGRMTETEWIAYNGNWYWLGENGAMATGWQLIDGVWEKFSEDGAWEYTWNGK